MGRQGGDKLKLAYRALIDGNKLANVAKRSTAGREKIVYAKLHVTGPTTAKSSPALALFLMRGKHDKYIYKFNLNSSGEKFFGKTAGLTGIFFTKLSWDNIGTGVSTLTNSRLIKDSNHIEANRAVIHGPSGIGPFMSSLYKFLLAPIPYEKFIKRTEIIDNESEHVDHNISVKKIEADPKCIRGSIPTVSYACSINDFRPTLLWDKIEEKLSITKLDRSKKAKALVWRIRNSSHEPLYHPITEKEIDREGLTRKSQSSVFIVIDCPTMDHFKILESSKTLQKYYQETADIEPVMIAHMAPDDVFSSQDYQRWVNKFGQTCKHMVLNEKSHLTYSEQESFLRLSFNKVSDKLFPPVYEKFIPVASPQEANVVQALPGMVLHINNCGEGVIQKDAVLDTMKYKKVSLEVENIHEEVSNVIKKFNNETNFTLENNSDEYYPRLVVLGTGASGSNAFRSQTGYLLLLNKDNSIVLDCGSEILEKIHLTFGDKTASVLATIKMIFISHKHIDHHSGFVSLLDEILEAQSDSPCEVVCLMTSHLIQFYKDYFWKYSRNNFDKTVFVSHANVWCRKYPDSDILLRLQNSLNLREIIPLPVEHSILTYGITLTTECGKKIVYSSDTLPLCKHLVQRGQNADLLIHDCLYIHKEWTSDANIRKHSTLDGALATSKAMNAKFTLLTHFSQFLPALPVRNLPNVFAGKVACAFDLLSVSLTDLHYLAKLEPVIFALYRDHIEGFEADLDRLKYKRMEMKKATRQLAGML